MGTDTSHHAQIEYQAMRGWLQTGLLLVDEQEGLCIRCNSRGSRISGVIFLVAAICCLITPFFFLWRGLWASQMTFVWIAGVWMCVVFSGCGWYGIAQARKTRGLVPLRISASGDQHSGPVTERMNVSVCVEAWNDPSAHKRWGVMSIVLSVDGERTRLCVLASSYGVKNLVKEWCARAGVGYEESTSEVMPGEDIVATKGVIAVA